MACIIRRAIAQRVVSVLKPHLTCEEDVAVEKLAPLVGVNKRNKTEDVDLSLSWSDATSLLCTEVKEMNSDVLNSIKGPKDFIAGDGIEQVVPRGENYLSFLVNKNYFIQEVLTGMYDVGNYWKEGNCLIGNLPFHNVIIEYSSPNIAKTFHVGHLRSTIIGNALANLHKFLNQNVTKINYLGDWGTQYGLLSVGFDKFGSEEELEKDPLQHLYTVYVAANSTAVTDEEFSRLARVEFQKLESGNEGLLLKWKKFRDISIKVFKETYDRLDVHFDVTDGESEHRKSAAEIVNRLLEEKLAERSSDGAVTIKIPYTSAAEKDVVIEKSDGSSLYLSRDIAAALDRKKKYDFDKMLYVVDNRQSDHFVCLKNILEKMGHEWHSKLHHIKFGLIEGMSSRRGEAIFLEELLNEAKTLARRNMEKSQNIKVQEDIRDEVADILGISGLIVQDLARARLKNYKFSWKETLATSRDSGIALQYTHARLAGLRRETDRKVNVHCETNVLQEPEVLQLVRQMARFDEVLCETADRMEPMVLVKYLFHLSHLIGAAYKVLPILGQEYVIAQARVLLFHSAHQVLNAGMKLLGLKPLDRM